MFDPQPVVYTAFLRDKTHQRRLAETKDPFLRKKRVEAWHAKEERQRMRRAATKAYEMVADARAPEWPKASFFRFTSLHREWGCDQHGYGWNLLGRGAVPESSVSASTTRLLVPLLRELVRRLYQGDSLHRFFHSTVVEMRETLGVEAEENDMDKEDMAEWGSVVRDEVAYPGSLVHLLRKEYAPVLNGEFQHVVDGLLQEGLVLLQAEFGMTTVPAEADFSRLQNLRYLYQHRKLPLTRQLLEKIEYMESRRWTDEEVHRALAFVPRRVYPPLETVEFGETDHPILSPLAPQSCLVEDGKRYRHIWEYVYFTLVLDYAVDAEEAFSRVRAVEDWSKPDRVLDEAKGRYMQSLLRRHVKEQLRDGEKRWKFLTTPALLEFHDPYDPVLTLAMRHVLKESRQELERDLTTLCRWVRPHRVVARRDFCAFHALRMNLKRWKALFPDKGKTTGIFARVLYNKKTLPHAFRTRVQSPEDVLKRMEKEWTGSILASLKQRKAQADVARLLHDACFPQQVFSRRPRPLELDDATDEFFRHVGRLL